jgi:hypothetical protein
MVDLTLIFQRFNIRRGFRLRNCEHAELQWFRVVSSSGLSHWRCWIIKCGFCYTRRLAGELNELVIARTQRLLFYIHDDSGVRACVLVNLHTTQSRISVNKPTLTYFQALNPIEVCWPVSFRKAPVQVVCIRMCTNRLPGVWAACDSQPQCTKD